MSFLAITSAQLPYGDNPTDGAGYRTWILLKKIAEDYDVQILSLYEDIYQGAIGEEVEERGMKITPVKCKRRVITQHIKKIRPDHIYLGSWPLFPLLPSFKASLIIDFIGPSLIENVYSKRYPRIIAVKIKGEAFSQADCILCSSGRLRYYLAGFLVSHGIDKKPDLIKVIQLVPPSELPVRNENFRSVKSERESLILVAGSLNPWYDYYTLFKAVGELSHLDFRVLFMGDNPTTIKKDIKRDLINFAEKEGCQEKVLITGVIPFRDRANYYLQADIGLNLARRSWEDELSGRARLVDYIWANLPVLTSGNDELSQLLVDGGGGLWYAPGHWRSLSILLERLLKDKGERDSMRRRVSVLKKRNFDYKVWLDPLLEFLEDDKRAALKKPSSFTKMMEKGYQLRRFFQITGVF